MQERPRTEVWRTPKRSAQSSVVLFRASVLECGSPLPLSHARDGKLTSLSATRAPSSTHVRAENPLATRACAPAFRPRDLFSHRLDLSKGTSLSRGKAAGGFASRFADRVGPVWLAVGGVGGILK